MIWLAISSKKEGLEFFKRVEAIDNCLSLAGSICIFFLTVGGGGGGRVGEGRLVFQSLRVNPYHLPAPVKLYLRTQL